MGLEQEPVREGRYTRQTQVSTALNTLDRNYLIAVLAINSKCVLPLLLVILDIGRRTQTRCLLRFFHARWETRNSMAVICDLKTEL